MVTLLSHPVKSKRMLLLGVFFISSWNIFPILQIQKPKNYRYIYFSAIAIAHHAIKYHILPVTALQYQIESLLTSYNQKYSSNHHY